MCRLDGISKSGYDAYVYRINHPDIEKQIQEENERKRMKAADESQRELLGHNALQKSFCTVRKTEMHLTDDSTYEEL